MSADSPQGAKAEITVKMGSMGMVFTGPVEIESVNEPEDGQDLRQHERGGRPEQRRGRRHDLDVGQPVNISANANVCGKAASMGEGTMLAVLTQLVKSFAGNLAKA